MFIENITAGLWNIFGIKPKSKAYTELVLCFFA